MNCLELGVPTIYRIPQMQHRDHGIDDNFVIICNITFSSNLKRMRFGFLGFVFYGFLRYALFGVVVFYYVSVVSQANIAE